MKKIILLFLIQLNFFYSYSQTRIIDSELITITPKQGDSVISRKNGVYIAKYIIKNNGPDTIIRTDRYSLKLVFSNVNYNTLTSYFNKKVNPGHSDTIEVSYKMIWDTDAENASFCTNLSLSYTNFDTIESELNTVNNKSCLTVSHISKLNIENTNKEKINIFPNPFNNLLNIETIAELNTFSIEIYNLTGKCVFKEIISDKNAKFDLSSLSSGIYYIKNISAKSTFSKKLIKL